MADTLLQFENFNFGPQEVRSIAELVMDDVFQVPEFEQFHTIVDDIITQKYIGFVGKGGLVGTADQGCDPQPQDYSISTRQLEWDPKSWEVLIHQCYSDLENTAAVYSLQTGVKIKDFTETDYQNLIEMTLFEAMKEFMWRTIWFDDTEIDNVSSSGILKDGVDKKYFNLLDGFWKQIYTRVTENVKQRITIAANAKTTYAEQELDPADAKKILQDLTYKAPMVLRQQEDKVIYATQSVVDAYEKSLSGTEIETMYANLVDGVKRLKINGVPIIPMPVWDDIIQTYFDNGTKLHDPFRAVMTTKRVLGVGMDDKSAPKTLQVWYDRDLRKVKTEAGGKIDVMLLDPSLFIAAY